MKKGTSWLPPMVVGAMVVFSIGFILGGVVLSNAAQAQGINNKMAAELDASLLNTTDAATLQAAGYSLEAIPETPPDVPQPVETWYSADSGMRVFATASSNIVTIERKATYGNPDTLRCMLDLPITDVAFGEAAIAQVDKEISTGLRPTAMVVYGEYTVGPRSGEGAKISLSSNAPPMLPKDLECTLQLPPIAGV